ncbi:hypothetical protein M2277_004991 [Paenibacillus sp. LBL]|nr:hypothetical protein [Paenibacillus sp. LBL]
MQGKILYCFDCYDMISFQFNGQSTYRPEKTQTKYSEMLRDWPKNKVITCDLCDRSVVYEQIKDNQWSQTVL